MSNRHSEERERWLCFAAEKIAKWFEDIGYSFPVNVRYTCGFPSRASLAKVKRRLGECWDAKSSADRHFNIFISPVVDKSIQALEVLVHEMVHAVVGTDAGHGPKFRDCAIRVGLEGPMTSTNASAYLQKRLEGIIEQLGEYPHGALKARTERKIKTYLLRVECPCCGYNVRVTNKWVEQGLPFCPKGQKMVLAPKPLLLMDVAV